MAEADKKKEIVDTDKEDENKESDVKQTPQYSPVEEQAMSQGWRPKDQFEGDPEEWVSAKEFIRRGELFGRINTYKHTIDNLQKTVNALVTHNEKMFDEQYKKQEQAIKIARKEAIKEGDTEVALELEEKLEAVQEEHKEKKKEFEASVPKATGPNPLEPVFAAWAEENRWYAIDDELHGYADGVAKKILKEAKDQGKTLEFDKLLHEVARKTKLRFPEKFGNTEQRQRTVERDGGEGKQKANSLRKDLQDVENSLSEGEKDIMNTLLKTTKMTKEKYLTQILELNKRKGR